jgi:hypothetical protein
MPGQIINRGKDTRLVRIFLARDPQSKQKYESFTVHGGKKEAQARLTEKLDQIHKGTYTPGSGRVLVSCRWRITKSS